MTQEQHPITPPPDLMQQWYMEAENQPGSYYAYITTQAARWGADQELEACCGWLSDELAVYLRVKRRPNEPPSLAERARMELDRLTALISSEGALAMAEPIRRALEALPDD